MQTPNKLKLLESLKKIESRHDIIFWEYCKRPNATIEKQTIRKTFTNDWGVKYDVHVWTGNYLVTGHFIKKVVKNKEDAEKYRVKYQKIIDNTPLRHFAMPRTLSDFVKGFVYAGNTLGVSVLSDL